MKNNFKQRILPDNFAEELLQLEIAYRLSAQPAQSLLRKLIELYSLGVQYYEAKRSHKYFYFSMKMKELFHSIEANKNYEKIEQAQIGVQETLQGDTNGHKKNQLLKTLNHEMTMNVNIQSVKTMVSSTKLKNFQAKRKVNEEIEKQNSRLLEKIQKRKKRAEHYKSFSTTSAGLTHHLKSDFSFEQGQEFSQNEIQLIGYTAYHCENKEFQIDQSGVKQAIE